MPTKTKEEILKEDLKESSENNTIDHNEVIDYSKYSVPGEAIARMLIEKLISLSIRQSKNIEIEKRMGDHCFDYIKNQVRPILEEKFIFHSEQNEKELFFSNYLDDKNTWIEIEEPGLTKEDRFMSTMIKMTNPFSDKEDDHIEETKNENENKKDLNLNLSEKKFTQRSTLKTLSNINNENINLMNLNKDKNEKNDKNDKKKKNIILPIEAVDIPNIREEFFHDQYDVENVFDLRQEMNDFIMKRNKEIKQKLLEEKLKEKEEKGKDKKKEKLFDFKKFTFDSNGEIIKFKALKADKLAKEFTLLRNNIKNLGTQEMTVPSPKKRRRSSISNVRDDGVITNPLDNTPDPFKEKINEKVKAEKIVPMGSNFDIMLPNVGVRIKENKKSKGGDMEFSKYFKKTSLEDYDKILNEFVPIQNQSMLKTSFASSTMNFEPKQNLTKTDLNDNNMNMTTINNNNNVNNINNVSNNPLLNSSNNVSKTERDNSPTRNYNYTVGNLNTSNPLLSSNPFLNTGTHLNLSNLDNTIKLNSKKMLSTSLKLEFDSIRNLTEIDEYRDKHKIYNQNLFNESILNRPVRPLDTTTINKFNTNIIRNRDWGVNRTSYDGANESIGNKKYKPNRSEYLRELGSTIMSGIKTKMPRQRNFKINI
jgi:hypothetical protein